MYVNLVLVKCIKLCEESVADATTRYKEEYQRHNYVTPTSYLELINLYITMLQEQRKILTEKISKYVGGLTKLDEANVIVQNLQVS